MENTLLVICLFFLTSSCSFAEHKSPTPDDVYIPNSAVTQPINPQQEFTSTPSATSPALSSAPQSSATPQPSSPKTTQVISSTPNDLPTAQIIGPDSIPPGVNPLTGLTVEDPGVLRFPPALVSVANFPISARPQAGLSFSPYVFEMYIGEGMTRFLAMFYGEYPHVNEANSDADGIAPVDNANIGPIRSGRLPYESIQKLYSGFLVMASAYRAVSEKLGFATNIYGSDEDDINSALIDVSKLQEIAEASQANRQNMNLTGNQFSSQEPSGGKAADHLWIFYNYLNQVDWRYDPTLGSYLRFQDEANGSGSFIPSTDRLNKTQLAFENIILLFAKHTVLNSEGTLIDVELLYTGNVAFLFRDGLVYPIYWNTLNGDYEKSSGLLRPIRFTDRSGNPISLKPGQTWVEMVDLTTTFEEIESGVWKARFYAP
jgi:hypothetical protein